MAAHPPEYQQKERRIEIRLSTHGKPV